MREQEHEAFKKAWAEYPSQDNEGYVPDRGAFKCGWFAALRWKRDQIEPPAEIKSCWFFHRWGKWMDGKVKRVFERRDRTTWDQNLDIQVRVCERCCMKQVRYL